MPKPFVPNYQNAPRTPEVIAAQRAAAKAGRRKRRLVDYESRMRFREDRAFIARECGVAYVELQTGVWAFDVPSGEGTMRGGECASGDARPVDDQTVADSRIYCTQLAHGPDESGRLGIVQDYARAAGF